MKKSLIIGLITFLSIPIVAFAEITRTDTAEIHIKSQIFQEMASGIKKSFKSSCGRAVPKRCHNRNREKAQDWVRGSLSGSDLKKIESKFCHVAKSDAVIDTELRVKIRGKTHNTGRKLKVKCDGSSTGGKSVQCPASIPVHAADVRGWTPQKNGAATETATFNKVSIHNKNVYCHYGKKGAYRMYQPFPSDVSNCQPGTGYNKSKALCN